MEVLLLPQSLVLALVAAVIFTWDQGGPPGPPKPPGPDPRNHIADIHRKLDSMKAVDVTAQRALGYSCEFLGSADQSLQSGQPFEADRLAEAADSLVHVAEHQQHLRGAGERRVSAAQSPEAIQDHLQRVYFRSQQADFFLSQSHDARATSFPKWARDFYQFAARDTNGRTSSPPTKMRRAAMM